MNTRPMTFQLELKTVNPHSTARTVTPVLADGTGQFQRMVNRDAILADVQTGDTIENLISRKRETVIGVTVLEWHEDEA